MAKFITIGYGDSAGYERTDPALREAAHAQDARLEAAGAVIGVAGKAVQVRNPQGRGMQVTQGAYLQSALPQAGFALIEAANLEEAVCMVAGTPCAVADGVVEVWPLETISGA